MRRYKIIVEGTTEPILVQAVEYHTALYRGIDKYLKAYKEITGKKPKSIKLEIKDEGDIKKIEELVT